MAKKATKSELAYIRSMEKRSGLELIERGVAAPLSREELPEPLQRFLKRERSMVHVRLSGPAKRKLEQRSKSLGLSPDELAKRWIEQQLKRDVG